MVNFQISYNLKFLPLIIYYFKTPKYFILVSTSFVYVQNKYNMLIARQHKNLILPSHTHFNILISWQAGGSHLNSPTTGILLIFQRSMGILLNYNFCCFLCTYKRNNKRNYYKRNYKRNYNYKRNRNFLSITVFLKYKIFFIFTVIIGARI